MTVKYYKFPSGYCRIQEYDNTGCPFLSGGWYYTASSKLDEIKELHPDATFIEVDKEYKV